MQTRTALAAAAALLIAVPDAEAAPVLYTNAGAFAAAIAGATVTTNGFGSLPSSGTLSSNVGSFNNVATVDGVTYRSSLPIQAGTIFPSDRFLGSNFTLAPSPFFSFTFGAANVFGITLDPETSAALNVAVNGTSLGAVTVPATASFLGIVDTSGTFTEVRLTAARFALGFVNFDNLQLGAVAVPAGSFPFLGALAMLGLLARRRLAEA